MRQNTFAYHIIPWVILILLITNASSITPAHAGQTTTLYLPLIRTPKSVAQLASERVNYYRQLAGAPLLQLHPALTAAAQNHANYDLLNYDDPSAWTAGPHGEVAGKPGFTGESSGARELAAGYPWAAGWEVMNYFDDPTRSVDDLMNSVYHRVGMLIWTHQYLGYGHGRSAGEAVDVIDFGRGATEPISASGVLAFPPALDHARQLIEVDHPEQGDRAALEAKLKRLARLYQDGMIDDTAYERDRDAIRAKLTIASTSLPLTDLRPVASLLGNLPELLKEATTEERRAILV